MSESRQAGGSGPVHPTEVLQLLMDDHSQHEEIQLSGVSVRRT